MNDDEDQHHRLLVADNIIEIQPTDSNPEDQCLCGSAHCQSIVLSRELDTILNPKVILHSTSQLDRIWPILTGSQMDVTSYLALLAKYRAERFCGLAWPPNHVAYRCRTCSKSLTMALCVDCFKDGDHEGHDYNMFKSRSGGACDCGYNLMKDSGHCKRHGSNAVAERSEEQLPDSLICLPRRAMPRLIHRLAIQLRRSHVDLVAGETDLYLTDFLIQLASSGAVLRGLMIDALVSEDVYSSQIKLLSHHHDKDLANTINEGLKKLKREQKGLSSFKLPEEWYSSVDNIDAFCDNKPLKCFVDELVFWTVAFEFPQKLVCFLLGFLMDDNYRQVFARAFVKRYPQIIVLLTGAKGEPRRHQRDSFEQLTRRILPISGQVYIDDNLTRLLCDQEHTLHVLIYCLRVAIEGSVYDGLKGMLKVNPLGFNSDWPPKVVCCDNLTIRDRHLSSFTEDINTILYYEHGVMKLIKDPDLLNVWLEMLSYFQTMSPSKRELAEHLPFETGPQAPIFTIEADFCLSPMWSILNHLRNESVLPHAQTLMRSIHANLAYWFYQMNIGPNSSLEPYHISFHVPLHRMFAATVRHLLFTLNRSEEEVYNFIADNQASLGDKYTYRSASGTTVSISTGDFFKMLLLHPLQALILYHETRSNMWTRNGLLTTNQAATYVHCVYCHSTIDLDMFLLKYCASKLNPNYYLKTIMSRFHAWKWLSYKSNTLMSNTANDMRRLYNFNILPEQIVQMVESFLLVIIQLLTLNIHCNNNEKEHTKEEMIAMISVQDRPYSYLIDMLPERTVAEPSSSEEKLIPLLDELTIYKPAQHGYGGSPLLQGCYTLKPSVWDEDYNPIQVQYRFYQKRDYQQSLERFFQHSKLTGKLEKRHHPSVLWPPLKVPRNIGQFGNLDLSPMIECQTLVGIVFSIIYKSLHVVDVPDMIVSYAIYLLELALRKSLAEPEKMNLPSAKPKMNPTFTGRWQYRLLKASPSVFDDRICIKGNAIYADYGQRIDNGNEDRMFPVVTSALDLAFEATWFPFESIVNNFLVLIEDVHSTSQKDFESVLKFQDEFGNQEDSKGHLVDAEMSWLSEKLETNEEEQRTYGEGDERMCDEEDDEDEDEEEDDDDIDCDEEDSDVDGDIDDDEEDEGVSESRTSRVGNDIASPDTDSDNEMSELFRHRRVMTSRRASTVNNETNTGSRSDHHRGATHDRATNTSLWAELEAAGMAGLSDITNFGSLAAYNYVRGFSVSTFRREMMTNLSRLGQQQQQQPQQQGASGDVNSAGTRLQAEHLPSQAQPSPSDPRQPIPMTTDSDHTYSAPSVSLETSMETESLPQSQSAALSLLPVDTRAGIDLPDRLAMAAELGQRPSRQDDDDNDDDRARPEDQLPSQLYPENLVTRRRAILASESRPMLTGSTQRLALEGNPSRSATDKPLTQINQKQQQSSPQQQLSEVDIQARFTGFFQSRSDGLHRCSGSRGFRTRQMARRGGGYRGGRGGGGGSAPVTPFAVHNPNIPPTANRISDSGSVVTGSAVGGGGSGGGGVSVGSGARQLPVPPFSRPPSLRSHHHHQRSTAMRSYCASRASRSSTKNTNNSHPSATTARQQVQQERPTRIRRSRRDQMRHGESILTLLLRLHAKYTQKARSYKYLPERAKLNSSSERARIGDGVHFVTIVLDLICTLDQRMRSRLDLLQDLIWCKEEKESQGEEAGGGGCKEEDSTMLSDDLASDGVKTPLGGWRARANTGGGARPPRPSSSTSLANEMESLTAATSYQSPVGLSQQQQNVEKRRQRAKEIQNRLMAEFASKQSAFIEKYECAGGAMGRPAAHSADKIGKTTSGGGGGCEEEEPINLSSKVDAGKQQLDSKSAQMSDCDKAREKQQLTRAADDASSPLDKTADQSPDGGQRSTAAQATTQWQEDRDSAPQGVRGGGGATTVYECCICGVEGPSDLANPLGQVVLLQSSSIYGHAHLRPRQERQLPCDELDQQRLKEETYAKYLERRIDLLCEHFSESSWLDSINIGAEGGVHVQSCGHYLHIECHQSYIKSLDQMDRLRARNDTDEFLCPVCRQLANSVLPILSDIRRPGELSLALIAGAHLDDQVSQVSQLLSSRLPPDQRELQSSAAFCAHLTKATGPQYRLVRSQASMHSLFLFLTSIARTNLETEVIVRSTRSLSQQHQDPANSPTQQQQQQPNNRAARRSCFQLLFHVLALNAQTLINDQWFTCDHIWSHLTHRIDEKNRLSVKPMNSEVPLLLRDPTAMLLQFLFAISSSPGSLCYPANFACLVQILFNLTVIQSVALLLSYLQQDELEEVEATAAAKWDNKGPQATRDKQQQDEKDFAKLCSQIMSRLGQLLASSEEPLMNSVVRNCWLRFSICSAGKRLAQVEGAARVSRIWLIENRVKLACLPFLRAAACLQHYLYDQGFPELEILDEQQLDHCWLVERDFAKLSSYLNLAWPVQVNSLSSSKEAKLIRTLSWTTEAGIGGELLLRSWCDELLQFGLEFSIAARTLLVCRSIGWYRPSLMQLPRSFNDIFMFYYRKKCQLCQQVPKDVAVCLVCGAPICFRVSCCKDRSRSRQVHSQHCGANTAVFLAVHTSSIVVIRGNRACVWGSVYLDAHDEEDTGLQRGKPLYLVQERYQLLEQQWLTHSFDHTCGKRWIYLQEGQN